MARIRCASEILVRAHVDTALAHESLDAFLARRDAFGAQLRMHTGAALDATTAAMNHGEFQGNLRIGAFAL
jgi:hypothetical protein